MWRTTRPSCRMALGRAKQSSHKRQMLGGRFILTTESGTSGARHLQMASRFLGLWIGSTLTRHPTSDNVLEITVPQGRSEMGGATLSTFLIIFFSPLHTHRDQ